MTLLLIPVSYANDCPAPLTLDKVSFQLSAKQWVSTQTALLSTRVSATLTSADLAKARSGIMEKLAKITSGDWHIVQFDRSQDNSGMEKLDVMAQVRVDQSQLSSVYDAAKKISKPGETYQIAAIEFKPSLEEIQKAKTELRQFLNKQVQQELTQLNHSYTEQHFTISSLSYLDDMNAAPFQAPTMMMVAGARSSNPIAPIAVSNELIMTAVVEAGSVRGTTNLK